MGLWWRLGRLPGLQVEMTIDKLYVNYNYGRIMLRGRLPPDASELVAAAALSSGRKTRRRKEPGLKVAAPKAGLRSLAPSGVQLSS